MAIICILWETLLKFFISLFLYMEIFSFVKIFFSASVLCLLYNKNVLCIYLFNLKYLRTLDVLRILVFFFVNKIIMIVKKTQNIYIYVFIYNKKEKINIQEMAIKYQTQSMSSIHRQQKRGKTRTTIGIQLQVGEVEFYSCFLFFLQKKKKKRINTYKYTFIQ